MSRKAANEFGKRVEKALAPGYRIELRKGHWHVVNEKGNTITSWSGTPSDMRALKNAAGYLRRLGVVPDDFRA